MECQFCGDHECCCDDFAPDADDFDPDLCLEPDDESA